MGQAVSKCGKEFPGQPIRFLWVRGKFPSNIIVEHAPLSSFVDMGPVQIHPVALNRSRDAADKDHRTVRLQLFDDTDVGKRVVELTISVEIPRVIKEDQVAGVGNRSLMDHAMPLDVRVDQFDSVGPWIIRGIAVEINPMLQEDGSRDAGTVIGDLFALTGDGPGSDEL